MVIEMEQKCRHCLQNSKTRRKRCVNSQTMNIVLLPIGWETHSSPEMGASPQDIINFQVLDNSDILIGVFWTRLGTPTEDYQSGTVEEIEKHILSGKTTMLYFSDRTIKPSAIDREQDDKLKNFKESCYKRGLCSTYDDLDKFKEQLYGHLTNTVNRIQPVTVNHGNMEVSPHKFNEMSVGEIVLLKYAILNTNGEILRTSTFYDGGIIQTHNLKYTEIEDRRKFAKIDSALRGLVLKGLMEKVGIKGQMFKVTGHGYDFADNIQESMLNDYIALIENNDF